MSRCEHHSTSRSCRFNVKMSKHFVWISLLDFVLFIASWVLRSAHSTAVPQALVQVIYWITAFAGVLLATYGFVVLTRGRGEQMRASTLCILFALTPGCVGLVAILSHLGTRPV